MLLRNRLDYRTIIDVLDNMIGETEPIGETNADDKAFERMEVLEIVSDWCLDGFNFVSRFANRSEWSMQRAGKEAVTYLKRTRAWIDMILKEVEGNAKK